jgi:hypothetical protein
MVLQSTGPIGLSNVKAEFQGNEPISLAQYYQNAANGFTSNVAGIPNIGASINIAAFYGKTKAAAAAAFSAYVFTTHTFTNATATGRNGPTLAQCRSAYSGASWASSTTNFNVTTQGIQLWTVPATASYTITCAGAVGGNKIFTGFAGIVSRGTYALTEGTVVTIVVGQRGLNAGASGGGGGGGGSYVIYNATALIVGGGGGGAGNKSTGSAGVFSPSGDGAGGTATNNMGGGGGGYTGNGSALGTGGGGGLAFVNNAVGGAQSISSGFAGAGGFGGGGGGSDFNGWSGGGGGGYTGGAGSSATVPYDSGGGGGTAFGAGITNQGTNSADGYVTVTMI